MERRKFDIPLLCNIYENHYEDLVESRISYNELLSYVKDLIYEYNTVVAYAQELEDEVEEFNLIRM